MPGGLAALRAAPTCTALIRQSSWQLRSRRAACVHATRARQELDAGTARVTACGHSAPSSAPLHADNEMEPLHAPGPGATQTLHAQLHLRGAAAWAANILSCDTWRQQRATHAMRRVPQQPTPTPATSFGGAHLCNQIPLGPSHPGAAPCWPSSSAAPILSDQQCAHPCPRACAAMAAPTLQLARARQGPTDLTSPLRLIPLQLQLQPSQCRALLRYGRC
jgi:hypothetical protein